MKKLTLGVMESLTGGLISNLITNVAGSSDYFRGGIVSYSTDVKILYGVKESAVEKFGVVSEEVALEMARSVRLAVGADIGLGITGVAGPSRLEGKKPGTVFMALSSPDREKAVKMLLPGDRLGVKMRASYGALFELKRFLENLR